MAEDKSNVDLSNNGINVQSLEVHEILDIYKTKVVNDSKQTFLSWIKYYTLIFGVVVWVVGMVGVEFFVEKLTEKKFKNEITKFEQKITELETKAENIIDENDRQIIILDNKIDQVENKMKSALSLTDDLTAKLRRKSKEIDEYYQYILFSSQDTAGQMLRFEKLNEKLRDQLLRLSYSIGELAIKDRDVLIDRDLKIFEYEVKAIFDNFLKNGTTHIDLSTRTDSSIEIPDSLINWLANLGYVVRNYPNVDENALKSVYGENFRSLITSSNFVMIKYTEDNEVIMQRIVEKLKEDPYFGKSRYDISKSNGDDSGSFVSILL